MNWPLWMDPRKNLAMEEFLDGACHVIRVEAPGVDPSQDLSVMVADGEVVIRAWRRRWPHDPEHTEFHYGDLERRIPLPRGARPDTLIARYDGTGILELRVEVARPDPIGRRIAVRTDAGMRGTAVPVAGEGNRHAVQAGNGRSRRASV